MRGTRAEQDAFFLHSPEDRGQARLGQDGRMEQSRASLKEKFIQGRSGKLGANQEVEVLDQPTPLHVMLRSQGDEA